MSVQTSTAAGRVLRCAALILGLVPLGSPAAPFAGHPDTSSTPIGGGGSAAARPGPPPGIAARAFADRAITMDEAVDMAQRRYNARVVRAEVADRGGRRVYLLRLLSDDGRVFNVRVDAATGSIQ